MHDISTGRERKMEFAIGICGYLCHLPARRGQDNQHSLIRLVRTFLTLTHHWTHRTYEYLPFDAGIRWYAGGAGCQEEQDKYDTSHGLYLGIREKLFTFY